MWSFLHKYGSPKYFYYTAGRWFRWSIVPSVLLIAVSYVAGLIFVPADYYQGEGFRIIYIHAPAAFLAMGIYASMALSALFFLVWRIKTAAMWVAASAPIGAWFSFLALFTGSIWGKPMWGTWWIWDARLTSALVLFFLYLGFIALHSAISDRQVGDKAGAYLVLVGVVNLPIIHYSVVWWNTLHQGATITRFGNPAIDSSMIYPLLGMIVGLFLFYFSVAMLRMRCEILRREQYTGWVTDLVSHLIGHNRSWE